jgi:protein-S-isoprenylcysteine O-methyltransferase Ste14
MQIVLVIFMGKVNTAGLTWLMYLGWLIWIISIIFGWLPIFTLKRKGKVPTGKSYIHTTKLVTTGLYSIVRHPQYTAGLLLSLSLLLISQDLWVVLIGIKIMVLLYIDIYLTDKWEIKKFGHKYEKYMQEVPRVNFILGIVRLIKKEGESNENQTISKS